MSFILNALRKSERERQQNREQSLSDHLQIDRSAKKGGVVRWLVLLIAANALALGYVLFQYRQNQDEGKPDKRLTTDIQAKAPQVNPVLSGQKKESKAQNTGSRLSIADIVTKKKTILPTSVAKVEKELPLAEQNSGPEKTPKKNDPEPIQMQTETTEIPWLSEMPHSFRRHVPAIDINVFVYSDQPENRFIMVSMQKFRVGQKIASGMELIEIQPNAIVVKYDGRRFKIRRD